MISRYEQERLKELSRQDREKNSMLEKNEGMLVKAKSLLEDRGQDYKGLESKDIDENDFEVKDHHNEAYKIRYLVEDVDLGEEEPTTVVIKSFASPDGANIPSVQIWAEDVRCLVELFDHPIYRLIPMKIYREDSPKEKPFFDYREHADMITLGLYDQILDRLQSQGQQALH